MNDIIRVHPNYTNAQTSLRFNYRTQQWSSIWSG